MAIIKVKWTDGEDKHMIHMGGSIPQAILTVEDMSDGMLSECLRYAIKKKLSALHVVNGESFPFGADVVLDIGYNLKDILITYHLTYLQQLRWLEGLTLPYVSCVYHHHLSILL